MSFAEVFSREVVASASGCECHFGEATYLHMFLPKDHARVYEFCGPHPTIYSLRVACARFGYFKGFGPEWRLARNPGGFVVFYDATCTESFSFRDVIAPWTPDGPELLLWMQAVIPVLSSPGCVPWERCYTPGMNGYCYLGCYPRSMWQRLALTLGAWPELVRLPSGRFPKASVAAVARFAKAMTERLVLHCTSELAACGAESVPLEVAIAASPTAVVGGVPVGSMPVSVDSRVIAIESVRQFFDNEVDVAYYRRRESALRLPGVEYPEFGLGQHTLRLQDLGMGQRVCAFRAGNWILEISRGVTVVFGNYRLRCARPTILFGQGGFALRVVAGTAPTLWVRSEPAWSWALVQRLGLDAEGIALRFLEDRRVGLCYRAAPWSQVSTRSGVVEFRPWYHEDSDTREGWIGHREYDVLKPGEARLSHCSYGYVVSVGSGGVTAGSLDVSSGGRVAFFPCPAALGSGSSCGIFVEFKDTAVPVGLPRMAFTPAELLASTPGLMFMGGDQHVPIASVSIVEEEDVVHSCYELSVSEARVLKHAGQVEAAMHL